MIRPSVKSQNCLRVIIKNLFPKNIQICEGIPGDPWRKKNMLVKQIPNCLSFEECFIFSVYFFFYITAVLFEWIRAVAIMVVGRSKEIWGWGCTFYSFSYHFFCKMATCLAKSSKVIFYAWKSFWNILVFPFPNEKWKEKFAIFLNF